MKMMNVPAAVAAVALFAAGFAPSPAFAGAQQEKMKACNKEAADKQLKGDERKKFMKECLSSAKSAAEPPAAAAPAAAPATGSDAKKSQQEKMKACNKDAGDKQLKGEERKKFMSECLKG
jgi:hypothetical protein